MTSPTLTIVIALLILAHLLCFLYACSIPIYWVDGEILQHGFFWSMNSTDDFGLHTGFRGADFMKPFIPAYVDGGFFRYRQFSYFVEMVSFKFWQFFGEVFSRNYTLVGLQILNAALLGLLLTRVVGNRRAGWIGALLFLNSGIALGTLLFPFRNAKILAMTLILMASVIGTQSRLRFVQSKARYFYGFFGCILLAFFTDEVSFFVFPLCLSVIAWKDGWRGLWNRKMMGGLIATVFLFLLFLFVFLKISRLFSGPLAIEDGLVLEFIHDLIRYWSDPLKTLYDIGLAFGNYFSRRNFGYWDQSLAGLLAAGSFFTLLFLSLWRWPHRRERWLIIAVSLILLFKAFLLPHSAGLHTTYMPTDTLFPSLFFFDFYYPYCEAVLFSLLLGLLLSRIIAQQKFFVLVLGLCLFISFSNVFHLRYGPPVSLQYHNWDETYRQKIAKNVLAVKRYLRETKGGPLYLSFPAGDAAIIKAMSGQQVPNVYCRMIPIKYLRAIEKGQIITPFTNARSRQFSPQEDDLSFARAFIDVKKAIVIDLESLRQKFGPKTLRPQLVLKTGMITPPVAFSSANHKIIFFVKGNAVIETRINDEVVRNFQTYGIAYQLFEVPLPGKNAVTSGQVQLAIIPFKDKEAVSFIGPIAD